MVRGAAKAAAQERNAKKHAVKQKGSELGLGAKALKVSCPICRQQLVDRHQLLQHYDSKHPKSSPPPETEG